MDIGHSLFVFKEEIVSKLDNISTRTGYSRNELIGVFLEYAIENCRIEEK